MKVIKTPSLEVVIVVSYPGYTSVIACVNIVISFVRLFTDISCLVVSLGTTAGIDVVFAVIIIVVVIVTAGVTEGVAGVVRIAGVIRIAKVAGVAEDAEDLETCAITVVVGTV
ncbi:22001_t:CDS:1 [Gigaspora margarita]|uniref:22001_t:CDS:1 n=1 Tax=Gigaspora margarita TaxID=4874 RepID=A0ABN7V8G8_GIGMA|nr:22001_t:CDS:1 [Gigaspora margarita]